MKATILVVLISSWIGLYAQSQIIVIPTEPGPNTILAQHPTQFLGYQQKVQKRKPKGPPKPTYCAVDGDGTTAVYCGYCVREHKEWCEDETTPIPECCAVIRQQQGIHSCRCCFDKPANLEERGTHQHQGYNEEFGID